MALARGWHRSNDSMATSTSTAGPAGPAGPEGPEGPEGPAETTPHNDHNQNLLNMTDEEFHAALQEEVQRLNNAGETPSPAAVSPRVAVTAAAAATTRPPPPKAAETPLEWIENLCWKRSTAASVDTADTVLLETPPTCYPSSKSPPLLLPIYHGLNGRREDKREKPRSPPEAGEGRCSAQNCPANGSCLGGAAPDTLVYEVDFKRATRTFLPGTELVGKVISRGDTVKVRERYRSIARSIAGLIR